MIISIKKVSSWYQVALAASRKGGVKIWSPKKCCFLVIFQTIAAISTAISIWLQILIQHEKLHKAVNFCTNRCYTFWSIGRKALNNSGRGTLRRKEVAAKAWVFCLCTYCNYWSKNQVNLWRVVTNSLVIGPFGMEWLPAEDRVHAEEVKIDTMITYSYIDKRYLCCPAFLMLNNPV